MDYNADCYKTVCDIFEAETVNVHFLWKCREKKLYKLGGTDFFPSYDVNPFTYISESGFLDERSSSVFEVFRARIDEFSSMGTAENSLAIVVKMKFKEDGGYSTCHLYTQFLKDEHNVVTAVHANIRPFSKKEELDREILSFFTSDKNPRLYAGSIDAMMKRNEDKQIAFIQFDIERFKLINSNYGTETGDALLAFVNESLAVICSSDQPFCRLTADVFMVVIPFTVEAEIIDFIHMLESRLIGYKDMEYRFIFGVSVVDDRTKHTRHFGDMASLARQSIKGNAMENICFYSDDMMSELKSRQVIEEKMYKALLNNEFIMFLQPKYCISTGRIIGAEALARWDNGEKGMVSPAEFIPVFERNGFIIKLDRIIWEKACQQIRKWIDAGVEPVPISVNVSREYLHNDEAVKILTGLVKKYGIPINMLELEITETTDTEGVERVVSEFKEKGFTMLMDDFGTGYSSLNTLMTTQFDVLKIDRSFLSEYMGTGRGRKIISHTISMSKDIGLDIIAEGVETDDQAQFLYSCGCDAAQGFYYSKPITCEQFDEMFIQGNK